MSVGDTLAPSRTAVKELRTLKITLPVKRGLDGPKLDRQPTSTARTAESFYHYPKVQEQRQI